MNKQILSDEREHLANLLEAIQRCVFFLEGIDNKIPWPLTENFLAEHKKDSGLFESLAAMNERFAKLQDTLAAGMRHAYLLLGESADNFLRILSAYEKWGVIDSIETWQLCRATRNLAAHEYDIQYRDIAAHFNTLHELRPVLYQTALAFIGHCETHLTVAPATNDFAEEFVEITTTFHF